VSLKPGPSSSTDDPSALRSRATRHLHARLGPLGGVVHQVAHHLEQVAFVDAPGQVGGSRL
jgi:hypothetical protein